MARRACFAYSRYLLVFALTLSCGFPEYGFPGEGASQNGGQGPGGSGGGGGGGPPPECFTNDDCRDPTEPFCAVDIHQCVECLTNGDCGRGLNCSLGHTCGQECADDADCNLANGGGAGGGAPQGGAGQGGAAEGG